MVDGTDEAETLAAEPVEAGEAATPESAPEQEAAPESGDDDKKDHWAQKRINELTRKRHEAEREAEKWRQKAQEATQTPTDDLDYDDQLIAKFNATTRQEQAKTAAETANELGQEAFSVRESLVRAKYADYDAVTKSPYVPITEQMAVVIRDSEAGPEIAYHLGKNPAEADAISRLPLHRQAAEIGKLEVRLTAPKPLPKTAPPPVSTVGGSSAGGTKDPSRMSMAEYVAWRNAK